MKVLMVIDKEGTAIGRLAELTKKAADWHEYRIVAVHPKRPSEAQMTAFEEGMAWCDVIDFRYWKTAEVLRAHYSITKPCMLTHYNPYDLNHQSWAEYKINVVVNSEQQAIMKHAATMIPLPIDLDFWHFKESAGEGPYQWELIMVANRIEGKKGILPVAKMAGEHKIKMLLVGQISDPTYYDECVKASQGYMDYQSDLTDEQLRERYYQSRIHICNSIDNFESGTLPILEAMACGTPVITRRVGHVHDLFNSRNMVVRKSSSDDTNELLVAIQELQNDTKYRQDMAVQARATLRVRSLDFYGRRYSKLYHQLKSHEDLVTVIVPTVAGPEQLAKTLAQILMQPIEDMEVIVCDDSENPEANEALIKELRKVTPYTLKFYATATYERMRLDPGTFIKTYGLARARNRGIIEAEGVWLAFVDDRLHLEKTALWELFKRRKDNTWLWGVKDESPKGFVENFSFVKRADLIRIGMFNEQITQYGGMTQEVRTRADLNKMQFELVNTAKATEAYKSRSRWTKYSSIAKSKAQCYKLYG